MLGVIDFSFIDFDMLFDMPSPDIFFPSISGVILPAETIIWSVPMFVIDLLWGQLPSVHCELAAPEHISQWLVAGFMDVIDGSDIVATEDVSALAKLRIATALIPNPAPINRTIAATFFQLVFILVTFKS